MATSFAPFSVSGTSRLNLKSTKLHSTNRNLLVQRKSNLAVTTKRLSPISAEYRESGGGRGGELLAGFILGGAICGTLGYLFAPEIRRTLLDENEFGFRKARRPVYYDDEDGFEKTREILNKKISQLSSVIDDVSSRLRGGKKGPSHIADDTIERSGREELTVDCL